MSTAARSRAPGRAAPQLGVLLVNLGTPAAPTPEAVRGYLAQFLSDRRVVDLPRALWLPLLHGFILRRRPARSARKYQAIWTPEGSPLAVHTARQAALLGAALGGACVAAAMRYGEPSVARGLSALASCERRLAVPLYPQYARSTTESVRDALPAAVPMIEHFHDHPAYIDALAARVREYWAARGRPQVLLLSFHGVPRRSVERGDPYRSQCETTARLLASRLGLGASQYRLCYQSRFGRAAWLEPYASATLAELGKAGTRRVDVFCPGFVSDCLETLEEIGIEGRRVFLRAGGAEFHLVPCLNEAPQWIEALARIVREHAP